MKYVLLLLCVLGVVVSSLALREHYRTEGFAPCDINEKWDCGIVNQSPYAMVGKVPVAAIGIAGYLLMGVQLSGVHIDCCWHRYSSDWDSPLTWHI